MSTAIMKTVDVINKCNACISAIDEARAAKDKRWLEAEIEDQRKSDRFWNKVSFGLFKIRSEEQLRIDSHNKLCGGEFNWGMYPDTVRHGKWRELAISLRRLAQNSHLDVMHVDEEGAVVINWT